MNVSIPTNVIRQVIFDLLFERANGIDDECQRISEEEMKDCNSTSEYTGEIGWTACGTRTLADDIKEGIMSIDEAIEALTPYELGELKSRLEKWYIENKGSHKQKM